MARKIRSDIKIGNLEKKLGLKPGAIRNPDGSDARSNKKLGTLRKEGAEVTNRKPKPTKPNLTTPDQKTALKRTVKSNPKIPLGLAKRVSAALKKSSKK